MEHCEIPRWQVIKSTLNNLSFDEFIEQFKTQESAQLLDARTEEEFQNWHIPKALNINYLSKTLADELEELPKEQTYFVYCRTSRRSLRICLLLKNMGFKKVFHLRDGVKDYIGRSID